MHKYLYDDLVDHIFKFINYENVLIEIKRLNDNVQNCFFRTIDRTHYINEEYCVSVILRKRRIFRRCCRRLALYHNFIITCKHYYKKVNKSINLNVEDKIFIKQILDNKD